MHLSSSTVLQVQLSVSGLEDLCALRLARCIAIMNVCTNVETEMLISFLIQSQRDSAKGLDLLLSLNATSMDLSVQYLFMNLEAGERQ